MDPCLYQRFRTDLLFSAPGRVSCFEKPKAERVAGNQERARRFSQEPISKNLA